jgi:phosphoribosyl 1,2-cyclic phosphate phosphodiesterase
MLREDVRALDALVMTHAHKDHTGGIDDIRAFNFIQQKPVTIYCDYATELGIKEQFSYAFTETDYPYLPKMDFVQITDDAFELAGLKFLPINVIHGKMPVKGFRIGDFTYITDAKEIIPSELDKIRGSKTLIINALRPEPHYSHLSIQEAIDIVQEIKPERAYFIHMSHQFGLHAAMQAQMPANITVAYDGLKIEV